MKLVFDCRNMERERFRLLFEFNDGSENLEVDGSDVKDLFMKVNVLDFTNCKSVHLTDNLTKIVTVCNVEESEQFTATTDSVYKLVADMFACYYKNINNLTGDSPKVDLVDGFSNITIKVR